MTPQQQAEHPADHTDYTAENARTFLELTRLLDDIEVRHPELSGPLRLTLLRAHRDAGTMWLDQSRFRHVVADLSRARDAAVAPGQPLSA